LDGMMARQLEEWIGLHSRDWRGDARLTPLAVLTKC